MSSLQVNMFCPKCNKDSTINIDGGNPPVMFECLNCNYRFHSAGFQLTGVDADVSLGSLESAILGGMINKQ